MLQPRSPLESLCLVQYEALQQLVDALRYRMTQPADATVPEQYWYSPLWAIEEAERVLHLPPDGQAAYLELLLHLEIAALAYEFAGDLHWIIYGEPRVRGQRSRAITEITEDLDRLTDLTRQVNTEYGDT